MSRMKNSIKNFAAVIGITIVTMFGLTGCISEPDNVDIQHIAIIMSNTKNEGSIDTRLFVDNISDLAMASDSTVSYFNCDGNPEYIDTFTIPKYKEGITEFKKKQLAKDYADQIITALTGLIPDSEEVDLYKAITLAARELHGYEGEKTLYIASSGLSTTGLVDFTSLYLEKDHSDELVEALQKELPDMRGLKIVWFGCGETCGEQTDLYESNRTILENTWKKILVAAGVKEENITFFTTLAVNSDNKPADLPNVSVVPIRQPISIVADDDFELQDKTKEDSGDNGNGKWLDLSDKIGFKADSTELLTSKDQVVESLSKIIRYLKDDSSRQILIVGTTSSWGEETALKNFSLGRCETIKSVLVTEGVAENQIRCVGAGYDNNLTINDRDDKGSLIEELAVKNRAVYLYTNAQSPAAQKILEQCG